MTKGFSGAAARSGFSLVELSIVLVILGLLTGGILTGQNLIRAAELRSVVTEFQRYAAATRTFQDKYLALPGDITNATEFWAAAHSTPATCKTTPSPGAATCNGDGNGIITHSTVSSNEPFRAFQQLANSGLIEGHYNGVKGPGLYEWDSVIGTNVPASRVSNAGWSIAAPMTVTGGSSAYHFDGHYGHRLVFGSKTADSTTGSPALLPEEAWNLDTKLDDGKPGLGKIRSQKNSSPTSPGCATTNDPSTSTYTLTNTSILCSLIFLPGW